MDYLVHCRVCNAPVARSARWCPHCGKRLPVRFLDRPGARVLIILSIIIIFISIASAFFNNVKEHESNSSYPSYSTKTCDYCDGSGWVSNGNVPKDTLDLTATHDICPKCNGSGILKNTFSQKATRITKAPVKQTEKVAAKPIDTSTSVPTTKPTAKATSNSSSSSSSSISSSFTNAYGTSTTICNHYGCTNYIASSGDTNCCPQHSKRCAYCGCYIDEDAWMCMKCITLGFEQAIPDNRKCDAGCGSHATKILTVTDPNGQVSCFFLCSSDYNTYKKKFNSISGYSAN